MAKRTKYSKPSAELILECLKQAGKALTAREISAKTGVNYNTVRGQLQKLRKKGLVKNVKRRWMPA